jgi:glutamine cyclotransferase
VARINELEWIDGKVWANVWFQDRIIVIDPDSGAVTASIDLAGLRPEETLEFRQDVLNGIARNPADGSIWVTGKRWPWLFQIEPIPLDEPAVPTTGADSR